MSKTKAVMDWLAGFDGEPPKLSSMPEESGDKGVQLVQSDYVLARYIDGTKLRRITVMLQYVADWSGGADSVNAESMEYGERWLEWVGSQFPGNVPDVGTVVRIEPIYNGPVLAMVYQDKAAARYQFTAQIDYRE